MRTHQLPPIQPLFRVYCHVFGTDINTINLAKIIQTKPRVLWKNGTWYRIFFSEWGPSQLYHVPYDITEENLWRVSLVWRERETINPFWHLTSFVLLPLFLKTFFFGGGELFLKRKETAFAFVLQGKYEHCLTRIVGIPDVKYCKVRSRSFCWFSCLWLVQ